MTVFDVFKIAGGLGMFMYGMQMMSDGLETAAGSRMRKLLEAPSKNRLLKYLTYLLGVGIGGAVTMVVQSSSATTVMVVGFVNAGLMNLTQAISIIMGANIGTTVTAQIIAFDVDQIAPFVVFLGMMLYMFFNKRKALKRTGYILLGFGILFWGISLMGEPLKALSQLPEFQNVLQSFSHPILAILVGTIFTAVIQSSSAATGIILAMYAANPEVMPFTTAAYLVLGTNIGTCITAVLASLSTSREAKRAALAHVLFNVIGTIIWGIVLGLFPSLLDWFENSFESPMRSVAMFHTFFNFATVGVLFFFIPILARLVHFIIPKQASEDKKARRLLYLDKNIMLTPAIAVEQAHREICRMGQMASANMTLALEAFREKNITKAQEVFEVEDTINFLNHQITAWLVRLRGLDLPDDELERLGMMFHVVSDWERIGDHAENIAEYAMLEGEDNAKISPAALQELEELSQKAMQVIALASEIYESNNADRLSEVDPLEQQVDDMSRKCVEAHIARLVKEVCDPRGGVVFTDMVSELERCADHATNIAYAILGETVWDADKHTLKKIFS